MTQKRLTGQLEAYWEQGMEGRIEYAFYPDDPALREAGTLPIWLKNGHFLRIFDGDDVLWEGEIQFVSRRGWFRDEQHDLPNGIWHDAKQKGVSYAQWIAWFWQKPPLRAELYLG